MSNGLLKFTFFGLLYLLFAGGNERNSVRLVATEQNVEVGQLLDNNSWSYAFFEQYANLAPSQLDTPCGAQIGQLVQALERNEMWALKFVDAWAKFPVGLLYGNFADLGHFEQCVNISVPQIAGTSSQLQGKYCLPVVPMGKLINQEDQVNLRLGVCIPAACSASQLEAALKPFLHDLFNASLVNQPTSWLSDNDCSIREGPKFETLDWVAVGIFSCVALLSLCGTIADYCTTQNDEVKLHPLLKAFSVRVNLRQLLHITKSSSSPQMIPCLNGMRCLALIWIVFGHGYLFLTTSPVINAWDIVNWVQSPFSMLLQTGTVTVDTFFFLSGLLVALVALKEMDKKSGSLHVPLMYLHRYLRLTPVLAAAVLFFMTFYRFLGNGPLWRSYTSSYELCEESWWATLLYVQNYAAAGRMCLGHAWYLAIDMQFFILSPLILIPLWKWKKRALAGVFVLGLLLFACVFSVTMIYDLSFLNIARNTGEDNMEMRKIYYSTPTRASPWIIGIVYGYFLHNRSGRKVHMPKWVVALGWLISMAALFAVIFALYPKFQLDAEPLTALETAFYVSLSRIAWPLALCWIVLCCTNGYAGPVNNFLSWWMWQPLAKLSYTMYIWHLMVEMANTGRIKTVTHFSNYDVMLRFWGDFGFTLLISTLIYVMVEAPTVGVEKYLLSPAVKVAKVKPATSSQQNLCD